MRLTSPDFQNGDVIPVRFTCDGEGARPDVTIAGAPDGTASFALVVDDPDAPAGTWTHWLIWNVPAGTTSFDGGLPEGTIQGVTSTGENAWHGPCPPVGSGLHHYYWRLYALDAVLDLSPESDAAALRGAMQGHVLAECSLMGTYDRS